MSQLIPIEMFLILEPLSPPAILTINDPPPNTFNTGLYFNALILTDTGTSTWCLFCH